MSGLGPFKSGVSLEAAETRQTFIYKTVESAAHFCMLTFALNFCYLFYGSTLHYCTSTIYEQVRNTRTSSNRSFSPWI
jgi:hypothetical protein